MTRQQFALAIMATEKWLENSARLLGVRLAYTAAEARWLGLVKLFNETIGVPLAAAGELATEAIRLDPKLDVAVLGKDKNARAAVAIFLARYYSAHIAALSAAIEFGGARRRGRPRAAKRRGKAAIESTARYGVDIDLLREGLKLSPAERLERVDENAAFINSLHRTGRPG
jgi:hypothetical protein